MTDQLLTDNLEWLARLAGNEVYEVPIRRNPERFTKKYRALEGPTFGGGWLPGRSGSLEGECELVLTWLAKAGMFTSVLPFNGPSGVIQIDKGTTRVEGDAASLHEALAKAVKTLNPLTCSVCNYEISAKDSVILAGKIHCNSPQKCQRNITDFPLSY